MMEVPGPAQGYVLPLEDACVFINDVKQTTDVAKGLRFHIGRQTAKKLRKAEPHGQRHLRLRRLG